MHMCIKAVLKYKWLMELDSIYSDGWMELFFLINSPISFNWKQPVKKRAINFNLYIFFVEI